MRQSIDHILTPETEKYFFQKQLLPPLLRGENVTVFRVPCSGVKRDMQFLAENAGILGFKELEKNRIVIINPLNLRDNKPESCFELIYNSLFQESENSDCRVGDEATTISRSAQSGTKNRERIYPEHGRRELVGFLYPRQGYCGVSYYSLTKLIKKQLKEGYHLTFIFEYFNKLNYPVEFFNNLHSFYQLDRSKIHYVFISSQDISYEQNFPKYGQLFKLMVENRIYFPVLGEEDVLFVAKRLNCKYNFGLNGPEIKRIVSLVGGHPSLLRRVLLQSGNFNASKEDLLNLILKKEEIHLILKEIWEPLSTEKKQCLASIANGTEINREMIPTYLLKMGFVNYEKDGCNLFSPLFNCFVKSQKLEKPLIFINREEGQIFVNGMPFKEKITPGECKLLDAFLKKPNEVISRDKIADALWGKDTYDKYSDWTIDQTIYLIRKKMKKWGIPPRNLQTIKGWGYRWLN